MSTHDASRVLMMHHEYSWRIMSTHDASWVFMMHHEYSWCIMSTHDASWVLMMHHEHSWCIMSTHEYSSCIMSIGLCRNLRSDTQQMDLAKDVHGFCHFLRWCCDWIEVLSRQKKENPLQVRPVASDCPVARLVCCNQLPSYLPTAGDRKSVV